MAMGPPRQHDDAGHGQRRHVFDLIGEPGGQDPRCRPGVVLGDDERIV
jgi:hypothetical protein